MTFGPDGRLYATTLLGFIYRYDVGSDGALSNETNIQSVRVKAGGNRAILGMAFHPDSTADNLVAYVHARQLHRHLRRRRAGVERRHQPTVRPGPAGRSTTR